MLRRMINAEVLLRTTFVAVAGALLYLVVSELWGHQFVRPFRFIFFGAIGISAVLANLAVFRRNSELRRK
jgi:hypothetical protein